MIMMILKLLGGEIRTSAQVMRRGGHASVLNVYQARAVRRTMSNAASISPSLAYEAANGTEHRQNHNWIGLGIVRRRMPHL